MKATAKAYTFASPTSLDTIQSLQKSMLSPPRRKNKKSSHSLKNKTLQTHRPQTKIRLIKPKKNIGNISELMTEKKGQLVTMYIKNYRNSSNIKHCSSIEHYRKLENDCFEIGNFSYTHR